MPISDLLASINGGSAPPAPKRKATDDLRSPIATKAYRPTPGTSNGTPRPSTDSKPARRPDPSDVATTKLTPKSNQTPRPSTDRPSAVASRPVTSSTLSKPSSALSNGVKSTTPGASAKRPAQPPVKVASSPANTAPTAPPKKGSYKALMERAKKAQEQRAAQGSAIRHQAVERAPLKSQMKSDAAFAEIRKAKAGLGDKDRPSYSGTARPGNGSRSGDRLPLRNGNAASGAPKGGSGRVGSAQNGKGLKGKAPPPVEEKKVKKAATATTGYQGTARGPVKTEKSSSSAGRPSTNARPRLPFQQQRRRRDDEYDEDMDDFIDDDEGEEDDGGGYGYGGHRYAEDDEEDESDMEAGLSDIEQEDRRATYLAMREDEKEAALEAAHRNKKLEKKRLYEARRGA